MSVDETIVGSNNNEVQVETQAEEIQQAEPGQITLGEDGDLNIPEGFWQGAESLDPIEETKTKEQERQAGPVQTEAPPVAYSPAELAEAFLGDSIDEKRLPPALAEYYKAITETAKKRNEIINMAPRPQPQQAPQQVQAPQPQQPQFSKESWDRLKEAGKELASRFLGIDPKNFDEYDSEHVTARNHAMMEIRDRARVMMEQQAQAQQRQAAVQQHQQQRVAAFNEMMADFQKNEPEFEEVNKFFDQWREKLTKREHDAVNAIMTQGDMGNVRKLWGKVAADYKASKATPGVSPHPLPRKGAEALPPTVMQAGGTNTGEPDRMVNIKNFGDMSPDEQVEFLINNKYSTP